MSRRIPGSARRSIRLAPRSTSRWMAVAASAPTPSPVLSPASAGRTTSVAWTSPVACAASTGAAAVTGAGTATGTTTLIAVAGCCTTGIAASAASAPRVAGTTVAAALAAIAALAASIAGITASASVAASARLRKGNRGGHLDVCTGTIVEAHVDRCRNRYSSRHHHEISPPARHQGSHLLPVRRTPRVLASRILFVILLHNAG